MSEDSNLKRSRASGEVLDYLLREFEVNQNPNPDQRKDISERTGMTEKAVRIWFQNRRAKLRKFERLGKSVKPGVASAVSPRGGIGSGASSRSNLLSNASMNALDHHLAAPSELNDKYCFIDCSSLSVGSWQRIKSGQHDHQALKTSLVNLSPFTLDHFMNTVDLMVILSKKNDEINYFFAAISNNSKILFRIFYPISSVISSSLLENNLSKENTELRLELSHTPKFSVYFFSGINANLNQWSICDDFSEDQQVSSAYYAPGGTSTPHVLVGTKTSLEFLHQYINSQTQPQSRTFRLAPLSTFENDVSGTGREGPNLVKTDSFELNRNIHEESGFGIKPHVAWQNSPQGEHEFAMKGISPLGEFDNQSQSPAVNQQSSANIGTKFSTGLTPKYGEIQEQSSKKTNSEYTDMFTDTPDFFSSVQTPGSHHILSHSSVRDQDNLINSPSANVHSYVNSGEHGNDDRSKNTETTHQTNALEEPPLAYVAPLYSSTLEHSDVYNQTSSHQNNYTMGVPISLNDFQAQDLIIENLTGTGNGPSTASNTQGAHEDQYLNFNGDA